MIYATASAWTFIVALAALALSAAATNLATAPEDEQIDRCIEFCAPHFPLVCDERRVECSETMAVEP